MISLETARQLKAAGLVWLPALHDFFAIPDRHLDDRVFVISEMLVTVDVLQGMQVVSFQGASEWALDSLVTSEAVWIPREDQLRQALEAALIAAGQPGVSLETSLEGARCAIQFQSERLAFPAGDASQAYAAALLHVLSHPEGRHPGDGA